MASAEAVCVLLLDLSTDLVKILLSNAFAFLKC